MATNEMAQLPADAVEQQRDAFIERFLQFASGTFGIFSIYIGDRLGLYWALRQYSPVNSTDLAAYTGTHERYIREWLEQQTVMGILQVEDETQDHIARRYTLPPGHVEPLTDCNSLNYLAPLAQLIAGAVKPLPELLDAYRTGKGVPFNAYGADLREGQAAINCPAFTHQLPREWLPSIPDLHARLQSDPPARVADIGCGFGWSSIGMAQGYPNITVDGFDLDAPSIEKAKENARINRVADRIAFHAVDAGNLPADGAYDLVTAFECIHDLSDPVRVLTTMRRLAGERGSVLVVDERVGHSFTSQGNDVEWMMYGWSVLHCLPVGMTDPPYTGTGTVMRLETLEKYAAQAGFGSVEVLPIDNFFFRFYRLHQ
jgi:2-polyprenyl-3-methyl-5-hydroxy-6-metoxy-1,4-benzoquinol methylase